MHKQHRFIKYFLLLVCLVRFALLNTSAQNVVRIEYFVDKDPGFGFANNVQLVPGQNINADFKFTVDTLKTGFHNLYIRALVNPYQVIENDKPVIKGGWSLVTNRSFYKEIFSTATQELPAIIKAEYFIDTDKGFGLNKNIPIVAGTDLSTLAFTFDITSLPAGFHNLYVRFKNATGNWSLCGVRNFYKESLSDGSINLPNIIKGEYFIDKDPGFDSAINIPVVAGKNLNNLNFTFNITGLTTGFHNLCVRFKDANGGWSQANVRTLYKEDLTTSDNTLPEVIRGEYFIDTDKGFGKGIPLSIASGSGAKSVSFMANLTAITTGFHNITTRFMDAKGRWSHANTRSFYKDTLTPASLSKIIKVEYFVDTDPGFGSGQAVSVTSSTNITSLTFPVNMTNVTIGNHKIYVRALDSAGKWSLVSSGSFTVKPPADIYITVGNLEANACAGASFKVPFSFNIPYGSNNIFTAQLSDGNGSFTNPVNIGSFTGNKKDTIKASIPANTPAGNAYRIRILASSPADTSAASSTFFEIKRMPEQASVINGKSQTCIGTEEYKVNVITPGVSYTWLLSGGGTLNTNGNTATINWITAGLHTLSVTPSNTCGKGLQTTLQIRVFKQAPSATPVIQLNGRTLTATGATAPDVSGYQWYKAGALISGATASTYNAVTDGTYTVRFDNPCGIGPESSPVTISTKKNQTITFDAIPAKTYGDTVIVHAVASSALLVTYTVVSGNAFVKGDTIFINGTGGITIKAYQAGNGSFNEAFADRSFTVKKAAAEIILSDLVKTYTGSAQTPAVKTIPAGLGVTLLFDGAAAAPVSAGSYHVQATINSGNYEGSDTGTFTIKSVSTPDLVMQNVSSNKSSVAPGDSITVSWKVANLGTASSIIDWTEKIYIQSSTGENRTVLKQISFLKSDSLNTGKAISRNDNVIIPDKLNIGDKGVFVVEVIPAPSIQEEVGRDTNNIRAQQTPFTIRKILKLELSDPQITEGASQPVVATVNRTGSLSKALTINVTFARANRFNFPVTVTIPQGQAGITFPVAAVENTLVEGVIKDTLRVSAAGFSGAKAALAILNNDEPSLSIKDLPDTVAEGAKINFRVVTDLAPTSPVEVFLTSDNQSSFPVPASVTIPAGALSALVTIALEQDSIPETDVKINIQAGGVNHHPATASVVVKDNDLPKLELIIQTNLISEAAGAFATQATLRRTANSNTIAFTANLSASRANALLFPATISLAENENEKTFTIGAIDNTLADGERNVVITAAVFVSSCGCNAPPLSSGSVTANIFISDNDGPALQLTAANLTLREGQSLAGALRITRNTSVGKALTVNLSSSDISEASVPVTATIPAGKVYIDVPVTTINDGLPDGNQQVYFQATAKGFSTGSVWVLVTDLNKPDLQIPLVTLSTPDIQASSVFNYQLSVTNTGFATAPAGILIKGYLSRDILLDETDTLISTDIISQNIPAGHTIQVLNAATAPELPARYKLIFKINPELILTELLTSNNLSAPVDLIVKPDYTATANVNLPYFKKGTTVPISGVALKRNGTRSANAQVEIHVVTNEFRRELSAITDGAGNYTAQFIPLPNEAGHYTVGASFPGIGDTTKQDAFNILGVRINNGEIPQFKVTLKDTLKGSLSVHNLSNETLTKFSLVPFSLPAGAYLRFDTIPAFKGNTTVNLPYKITGSALSAGNNFEVATLQAISNEGFIQTADVFYYSQAPGAYLVANVSKLEVSASQKKGERLIEFALVNKGKGATGSVSINLPKVNWLSSVTPAVLPSISSGDTAIIILKFLALPEVPFNYPITGSIGIGVQNGNSFNLPFSFEKVSQSTGTVSITVTDQFTYFSEGEPKVKGASVQIKNYFSGEVYAEGVTDTAGVFIVAGIPEGRHRIIVEKDKHLPYNSTINIEPGDTVESTVFLNYQAITFSWNVVPTAVQDQYDITLTSTFETHVPMPVVTIEMPKVMPQLSGQEVYAFNVTLTNHGLITAKDVALNLATGDPEYEFITNYVTSDLLAQQSIQVPVIMRRRANNVGTQGRPSMASLSQFLGITPANYNEAAAGGGRCKDYFTIYYWYKCSLTTGLWQTGAFEFSFPERSCGGSSFGDGILIGGGNFPYNGNGIYIFPPGFCPFCSNSGGTTSTPQFETERKSCAECILKLIKVVIGCAGPKKWKCAKSIIQAIYVCSNTSGTISGNAKNAAAFDKVNIDASTDADAVFREIANKLQIAVDAYQANENIDREYFGDMVESDAFIFLDSLLKPYTSSYDSISVTAQLSILANMEGYDIPASAIQAFFVRWNISVRARNEGIMSPNTKYPGIINWKLVKAYADSVIKANQMALEKGFASIDKLFEQANNDLDTILNGQKDAVCATVKVQFNQRLTMTREAFEGTLEIFNGHPTDKMDSLSVNISITDENGVPSNGKFQISTKKLTNISDIKGKGNIEAQQKGSVQFIFIPEKSAAPTVPKIYKFGGSVRYFDPYAQRIVALPLAAVPLTVNPSPDLMLQYFMERNILSDDPLTQDVVEPTIPAELAVMVENLGYGPAVNMSISSAQPKIVENEKGLAINFQLIGSNYQGQPKKLGITDINFGTIPALETRIGQWYFTSSLLGKFVSYEASVRHLNSRGNPGLSLIRGVKLHELTKSVKVYGGLDDGINDFLVNDIFDVNDVPDILYYSQGTRTEKVYPAKSGSFSSLVSPPGFKNMLTVLPSNTGWNYIKVDDPGNRQYEILSVIRSDGQVIPLDNAWLTFVTLPVSRPPVYENKFHFIDSFPSLKPVSYTVTWKPGNLNVPNIISIDGAPKEVTGTQVKSLRVIFDKAIDAATFTFDDLQLNFQGGPNISDKNITIKKTDSSTFDIDLSKLTLGNGFYAFTVQGAGIADKYGINGKSGKRVTWSQFLDIPTVQAFEGLPENNVAAAYDTIRIRFNLALDSNTVTPARFLIYKDSVLQPGNVLIDSSSKDKKMYYLSGLKNILTSSGKYELRVDLPKIKSQAGISGVQTQSIELLVDRTGPVIVNLKTAGDGGLDAGHITFVDILFDEEVKNFNTAALKLTHNGDLLPLSITQLSYTNLKTWRAGNFGMLTYPEGDYTFTITLSGLKDAAGNKGIGSKKVSWKVNRSFPLAITNMIISPDLGFSKTDRITSGDSLNVRFNLSADASQVTISQFDLSGETVLAMLPGTKAGSVSRSFNLSTGGNTGIRVTATSMNGGTGTAEDSLFIDQKALTASWLFDRNQRRSTQADTVTVHFSSKLLSNTAFLSAVQFRRNGVLLPAGKLKFIAVKDTVYHIYSLRKASDLPGNYELRLNLTAFNKYLSGLKGNGITSISWTVLSTNRPPVAKAGMDTTLTAPGTFTLNGSASSDPDSDPIRYRWVAPKGVVLSDSTSAKPTFAVTAAHEGNIYPFLLIVSDSSLFTTDVVNITVRFTNKPPTITLTNPANNQTFLKGTTIYLEAAAHDYDGTVSKVEFYNGTALLSTLSQAPYKFNLKTGKLGNFIFTAKATDNSGAVTTSAAINVSVVPNQPPTVSITKPAIGQSFTAPATVNFEIAAQDADGRIVQVRLYDGVNLLLLTNEYKLPYTYQWNNVPAGTYTVTAVAKDNLGVETTSAPVTVTVTSAGTPIVQSRPAVTNSKTRDEVLNLTLVPNPARSTLSLYTSGFKKDKQITVSVISPLGVVMKTIPSASSNQVIKLNISFLAGGLYTVKVSGGADVLYRQFLKL